MNKEQAIKILESKVLKSEESLKHFPKESQGYAANEARIIAYNIAINKIEQIDEPQAEKVEVPEFVAEWIEYAKKKGHTVIESANPWDMYGAEWSKADIWNKDNQDTFARAFMDGYTVKPKRWVVRQGGSEVWYLQGFRNSLDGDIVKQWCSHEGCIKFTNKAKAEAVATLVEGSVEEID